MLWSQNSLRHYHKIDRQIKINRPEIVIKYHVDLAMSSGKIYLLKYEKLS